MKKIKYFKVINSLIESTICIVNRKNVKSSALALLVILLTSSAIYAQQDATPSDSFEVSSVFSDNMVLQQNEPIIVWGTSEHEGSLINGKFGDSYSSSIVEDGRWEMAFSPRAASTDLFQLEIYGSEKAEHTVFENIMIGDVWLVIGQSNVEFKFGALADYEQLVSDVSDNTNVSIIYFNSNDYKAAAKDKAYDAYANKNWNRLSHKTNINSSALGTLFSLELSKLSENNIPIGIISVGFAGQELACFVQPEISETLSGFGDKSTAYSSFVKPITKLPFKGVVWYQGEANAPYYTEYAEGLSDFFTSLREEKNLVNKSFPFYIVELPPCFPAPENYTSNDWQFVDFGAVRAVCGSVPMTVENCYICSTSDTWNQRDFANNLHPDNKADIAKRLALMVCSNEWGFTQHLQENAPIVKKIVPLDDTGLAYDIYFDNVWEGLMWAEEKGKGFEAIGKDWNFIDITVDITAEDVVTIKANEKIYTLRYSWYTDNVFPEDAGLCSSSSIPAAAFSYEVNERPVSAISRLRIMANNIIRVLYKHSIFFLVILIFAILLILLYIFNKKERKK